MTLHRNWPLIATLGITLGTALVLLAMGRTPICTCGTIELWHGEVASAENSQHIADWYTLSHVVHGLLFFGLFWVIGRRWSLGWRLVAATVIEAAWEIVENTDAVINRYREATIALDYYGDSVLNSVSDIAAMWLGFWIALRLGLWKSIAVILVLELVALAAIRDGLTLNVLMLLYPIDAVRDWQAAG